MAMPSSKSVQVDLIAASADDDQSNWSKSKKKRMRMKRKKEAAKKLLLEGEGVGMDGHANHKQSAQQTMSQKQRLTDSQDGSNKKNGGDATSRKRQRTNSSESLSTAVSTTSDSQSNENSQGMSGAVGSPSTKKKKKKKSKSNTPATPNNELESSAPKVMQKHNLPSTSKTKHDAEGSNQPRRKSADESDGKKKNNEDTHVSNCSNKNSDDHKITSPKPPMSTLQKSFLERLTSSRFRELNEELYTQSSQRSFQQFTSNPELFEQYHVGFRKQVKEWPVNPIDVIYKKVVNGWKKGRRENQVANEKEVKTGDDDNDVGNMNDDNKKQRKQMVVADFGCGDAKLAERLSALRIDGTGSITTAANQSQTTATSTSSKKKKSSANRNFSSSWCPFKIHSFDLVSGGNPLVTPADMSNVPLENESIDVGVYCLALMGTNVADFVREGWRVLKFGGVLNVAEVRSRLEAAAGGEKEEGDGKRGKLNSGRKQPKDIVTKNGKNIKGKDGSFDSQPLMLLDEFLSLMERCGFQCTNLDRSNKMFLFMDFVKVDGSKGLSEKERFTAKPCIYKRR